MKSTFARKLALIISLSLTPVMNLSAANSADFKSIINDTTFYDPTNYNCTSTGSSSSNPSTPSYTAYHTYPTANPVNGADIMDYLHKNGYTWIAAAGAVASMWGESKWDPEAIGTGGRGLIGWSPASKLPDSAYTGNASNDMNAQLPLILTFVTDNSDTQYVDQMNQATSVADAANIWGPDVEKFGKNDVHPQGISAATSIMNQLMSGTAIANVTLTGSGGTAPTSSQPTSDSTDSNSGCCNDSAAATTTSGSSGTFASLAGTDAAISGTFILGFDASTPQSTIENVFSKYKPAGLYILGTTDAASAGFTASFFQKLASDAGHPIIASSDEEGWVTRYTYSPTIPSAGVMSSTMTPTQITAEGKRLGDAMKQNGLNTDLAPVLDIGTGSSSDFYQQDNRTFGDSASSVASGAGAFAAGLQAAGINPVYKHFPGLGTAKGINGNPDNSTDDGSATTTLTASDLAPYTALANKNNAAVMMDNASISGLINTGGTPASQSLAAVALLRGPKVNFTGLIMTDDLYAKSVSPSDTSDQLASALVTALQVGVDAPLEKFTDTSTLDTAITDAKNAGVKTGPALALLDKFLGQTTGSGGTGSSSDSNCCGSTVSSPSSGGISSGSVYILGDSITALTTPDYTSAFKSKGITANIDGLSGRAIDGPGYTNSGPANKLSGMQAISQDTSQIKSAAAIVVALGTNQGATSSQIQNVISALRKDNANAPIYWVNVIAVGTPTRSLGDVGSTNKAIDNDASSLNYGIINWFTAVDPGGNPESPNNPPDPNGYISTSDGLNVHPNSTGQVTLSNLVANAIASGSTDNSSDSSSGSGSGGCCSSSGTTTSTPSSGPTVAFYDSTDPSSFPASATASQPYHTATYTTSYTFLPGSAIGIAQSAVEATDDAAASKSNALDIEPGIASPSWAAKWVQARAKFTNGIIILYSDENDWPAVKASVATLPSNLQSRVRYWIASLGAAKVPSDQWGVQYAWGTGLNSYDSDVTTQTGWQELLNSPPQGSSSSGNCSTTAATGNAQQIAKSILANTNIDLTCLSSSVKEDVQDAANNQPGTAGAMTSANILKMIADVGQSHKVCVTAIQSNGQGHCGGQSKSTCPDDPHYLGRAVDFGSLDGQAITGRNAPALAVISIVEKDSSIGAIGQTNCGTTPPLPSGWTTFDDTCNHLHVQDVAPGYTP